MPHPIEIRLLHLSDTVRKTMPRRYRNGSADPDDPVGMAWLSVLEAVAALWGKVEVVVAMCGADRTAAGEGKIGLR